MVANEVKIQLQDSREVINGVEQFKELIYVDGQLDESGSSLETIVEELEFCGYTVTYLPNLSEFDSLD